MTNRYIVLDTNCLLQSLSRFSPYYCVWEAALGINPELLINMQMRYNMSVARQKKPLITFEK